MDTKNQTDSYSEDELVGMASNGELGAFNQLVLIYQDLAYNLAYSMMQDPFLAEDATQESFIKAFQKINTFRGGSFRAWLLRILTNTCYDQLRRLQRHPLQPLLPEDDHGEEIESSSWLADPTPSVQQTVEMNDEAACLHRMLEELPDVYRSAITLIDLHEFDYSEAATALKVPVGTVKSRLARARLQLKKRLEGECLNFSPSQVNRLGVAA